MNFEVLYRGSSYKSEFEIIGVFEKTPLEDLWRVANQSIYADLLLGLQQQFLRNDLCISVVSTESSFFVDLDKNSLNTHSTFKIMTTTDSSQIKSSASHNNANGTLELAVVTGEVIVDIPRKRLVQRVYNPVLKMVFDSDLRYFYVCELFS